jgi:hypothetical protein
MQAGLEPFARQASRIARPVGGLRLLANSTLQDGRLLGNFDQIEST